MRFVSPSPEATREAARLLAGCAEAQGGVVALSGALGAGKTAFVKGLAEGLGIDPARVASPSFVIASEYPTGPDTRVERLAHLDLYRVESAGELEDSGFLDLLSPGTLLAIEWADRFLAQLPAGRLEVHLSRPNAAAEASRRVLQAWASGPAAEALLACWRRALAELPWV